jgi:hypothetical protein
VQRPPVEGAVGFHVSEEECAALSPLPPAVDDRKLGFATLVIVVGEIRNVSTRWRKPGEFGFSGVSK